MENGQWKVLEPLIDEQLKIQVEISFERHYAFLRKHGLGRCKSVLDMGTGNGCFLGRVAGQNAGTKFYGLDNKAHMIEAARKIGAPNIEWILGDINDFRTLPNLKNVDGILMRYFILHLPNTREILAKLGQKTDRGCRLWIIDLDLDCYECEPHHESFRLMHNLVRRFCEKFSVDAKAATGLPELLEGCGFALEERAVAPFSNRGGDRRLFNKFLKNEMIFYSSFLKEDLNSPEMQSIFRFIDNEATDDRYDMRYGMVMIAALKL